jgi:hypothetical protein
MDFNTFSGMLEEIPPTHSHDIEGISFSGVCLVRLIVDGIDLATIPQFTGSLVVYNQLRESSIRAGRYLLFTSASGVADEAGWDKVHVSHLGEYVLWHLTRDDQPMRFCFKRTDYLNVIAELARRIHDATQRGLKLEPTHVIFPEE